MNRKYKSTHNDFKKKNKKTIYDKFQLTKKKELKEEKEPYLMTLSNRLNLPGDILAGAPILTATGRSELCIENYKGIIEYNSNIIKVQTKICKICVEGTNLNIDYFTNDEMRISGTIKTINYI